MFRKRKKQTQQNDAALAACRPTACKLLSILQQAPDGAELSAAVTDMQQSLQQLLVPQTSSTSAAATSGDTSARIAALLDSSSCAEALAALLSFESSSSWLLYSTIDMLYDLCAGDDESAQPDRPVLCQAFVTVGGCEGLISAAGKSDVRSRYNCQLYVAEVLLALSEQPDAAAAIAAAGGVEWLLQVPANSPKESSSRNSVSSSSSWELYLHKLSQHVQAQVMSLDVITQLGRHDSVKAAVAAAGGFKVIADLLSFRNPLPWQLVDRTAAKVALQFAACEALTLVTASAEGVAMAAAAACLRQLLRLLQSTEVELKLKQQAARAIHEIVQTHTAVQAAAVAVPGLLRTLLQQLRSNPGDGLLQTHTAAALAALVKQQEGRAAVAAAGGVQALVMALKHGSKQDGEPSCGLQLHVASALWRFAMDKSSSNSRDSNSSSRSYLAAMVAAGCILPVVTAIQDCVTTGDVGAALPVCGITSELAANDGYRAGLIASGGVPAVTQLLQTLTAAPDDSSSSSSSSEGGSSSSSSSSSSASNDESADTSAAEAHKHAQASSRGMSLLLSATLLVTLSVTKVTIMTDWECCLMRSAVH
jgi:hypothetical protein